MTTYVMRLDDACPHWDVDKWARMEGVLDRFGIKPLVGLIPAVEDPELLKYPADDGYWGRVEGWKEKGWELALHGCTHVYCTGSGGLNPVNDRSEFAGLPLDVQREKVSRGIAELAVHDVSPRVFFAPSHTFDANTLEALRLESGIRVVSDTVALKPYSRDGFTFVPQQSGRARVLPFPLVTFCYHPNTMEDGDFRALEAFLEKNAGKFGAFPTGQAKRAFGPLDALLCKLYFARRS